MSKKQGHLRGEETVNGYFECYCDANLSIRWGYAIVHCFAVQNNKLFHSKKRAPRNRKMTIFNRFLSKHTTLLEFLPKTNNHGRGNENYAMHFQVFLMKISCNEATSDRFIDKRVVFLKRDSIWRISCEQSVYQAGTIRRFGDNLSNQYRAIVSHNRSLIISHKRSARFSPETLEVKR